MFEELLLRRNQAKLTSSMKDKFVDALLRLKSDGKYDQYVQWHIDAMNNATPNTVSSFIRNSAHKGPAFLPWHREFLRRFELDLNAIDNDVTLPYWDWTVDGHDIGDSIFDTNFMGNADEGPFKSSNWTFDSSWSSDLRVGIGVHRILNLNNLSFPSISNVNACLAHNDYDSAPWDMASPSGFRNTLEGFNGLNGLHNRIHRIIGGDMGRAYSPFDPLFFLHHANVDRLWAEWQITHPGPDHYVPDDNASSDLLGHRLNDSMYPWNDPAFPELVTTTNVLYHTALGYTYDSIYPRTVEIKKYILLKRRNSNRIICYDENDDHCMIISFYDRDTIPNNEISNNGSYGIMRVHASEYSNYVDMLRNEKPVYARLYPNASSHYLQTNLESIGESE